MLFRSHLSGAHPLVGVDVGCAEVLVAVGTHDGSVFPFRRHNDNNNHDIKNFSGAEIKKAEKHTAPLSVELKKKLNF